MSPELWQKVKAVLDDAVAVSPSGRAEFFRNACPDDDLVRREVEALLKYDEPRYSVLDDPAVSFAWSEDPVSQTSAFIGKNVGNYRVIDVIAAGGMGTVFLAERADGTFDQKVALKVIKRGMDSEAVLQRFFNERRILASLDHPYIARLLDGGTTEDGVPYYVMELVDGIPLTDYVEENEVSVDERLILFTKIASAVTYAHQNLVIHRDLKPSNILVTPAGEPKLLDFGIAKLLMSGNSGLITATQQFILTPDYASPEQIRGMNLSTATDIYSLGVILYEILTGCKPYAVGNQNFAEMMRVICDVAPTAPSRSGSSNASKLNGDLDNIVLKALRKELERRYTTVEQFRIDVQRHLDKLPIFAGGDSWRYRTSKFVSRHRFGASMGLIIAVTVVIGLFTTIYQMNIARQEHAKAEQRFNDVRQLANSILFEINDKIRESPIKARELLVMRSVEYLDKLVRESEGDVVLQTELATAYEKIGMVQAELFQPGLGKTSDAFDSHQKALEIRAKIFSLDQRDVPRGTELMRSHMLVGDINSMTGKIDDARNSYERSAKLGEQLLVIEPRNAELRKVLGSDYARLGQNVLRSGSLGKALEYYERSLAIKRDILADLPADAGRQHSIGVIYNYIGYVKLEMLKFDEALDYFTRSLQIDEQIAADDPKNATYSGYISDGHFWLGVVKTEMGDPYGAQQHLQKAFAIQSNLVESDPANYGNRNGLADTQMELGRALTKQGDFPDAQQKFDAALANYRSVWQADTKNLNAFAQIQLTQRLTAEMLFLKGDRPRGESLLSKTINDLEILINSDRNNSSWQYELGKCLLTLGIERSRFGKETAALADLRYASAILERLASNSPENMRLRRDADLAASYISKVSR